MIVRAIFRTLAGLAFFAAGLSKLVGHGAAAEQFARWQLPLPGLFALLVGAIELVCGLLLAAGALTRPVALVLGTIMVGAVVTAGRIDGGMHVIVPALLFFVLVYFAWSTGRFAEPRPPRRPGVQ
jgi:putative oxidoreductase